MEDVVKESIKYIQPDVLPWFIFLAVFLWLGWKLLNRLLGILSKSVDELSGSLKEMASDVKALRNAFEKSMEQTDHRLEKLEDKIDKIEIIVLNKGN